MSFFRKLFIEDNTFGTGRDELNLLGKLLFEDTLYSWFKVDHCKYTLKRRKQQMSLAYVIATMLFIMGSVAWGISLMAFPPLAFIGCLTGLFVELILYSRHASHSKAGWVVHPYSFTRLIVMLNSWIWDSVLSPIRSLCYFFKEDSDTKFDDIINSRGNHANLAGTICTGLGIALFCILAFNPYTGLGLLALSVAVGTTILAGALIAKTFEFFGRWYGARKTRELALEATGSENLPEVKIHSSLSPVTIQRGNDSPQEELTTDFYLTTKDGNYLLYQGDSKTPVYEQAARGSTPPRSFTLIRDSHRVVYQNATNEQLKEEAAHHLEEEFKKKIMRFPLQDNDNDPMHNHVFRLTYEELNILRQLKDIKEIKPLAPVECQSMHICSTKKILQNTCSEILTPQHHLGKKPGCAALEYNEDKDTYRDFQSLEVKQGKDEFKKFFLEKSKVSNMTDVNYLAQKKLNILKETVRYQSTTSNESKPLGKEAKEIREKLETDPERRCFDSAVAVFNTQGISELIAESFGPSW